jgi:Family of unknown function (DUF6535)
VTLSVQDLRRDPQDTSAFYLRNIFQLLADPKVSSSSISSTIATPPTFSPPKYAIWVNSLWFLALVINLTCALLATFLQQWARRYVRITQPPRYSPHRRARIRSFFANGVDNLHLPWAVEALPTLLHLSFFLFFAGLLISLFNVNHTVFRVVVLWVGFSAVMYGCITILPIFRHDSPYYAPLSPSTWLIYTSIAYSISQILSLITKSWFFGHASWDRFSKSKDKYLEWFSLGMRRVAEETVLEHSSEIDGRILKWTFDSLDEDSELEKFLEGIPGFCSSQVVENPHRSLAKLGELGLSLALNRLLYRTLTSDLVSESVKRARLAICVTAVEAAHFHFTARWMLRGIFEWGVSGVLRSVEMGHALKHRGYGSNQGSGLCAQGIVAGIIASVTEHDARWIALTVDQLDISDSVLRQYLAHGDSVLLANLIHITRLFFRSYLNGDQHMASALSYILPSITPFDVQNALPRLQHDFCIMWNEIVLEARKSDTWSTPVAILIDIHVIYLALHQDADSSLTEVFASITADPVGWRGLLSLPSCGIPGHVSDSTSDRFGVVNDSAGESPTIPHADAPLPLPDAIVVSPLSTWTQLPD